MEKVDEPSSNSFRIFFFRNTNIQALVTTGEGRFYSNGLDLDWIIPTQTTNPEEIRDFFMSWNKLILRLVTFPVPTIAALNGKNNWKTGLA